MKSAEKQTGGDLLRHLILAWLTAVTAEYLLLAPRLRDLHSVDSLNHMVQWRFLLIFAVTAAGLILASRKWEIRKQERWAMTGVFLVLAWTAAAASFSWPFFCVCSLITAGLLIFALYGWDHEQILSPRRLWLWLTVLASLCFFLFISLWTLSRLEIYSTSTYDLGLFAQMFHYMKTTGQPLTTLERDGLMSHFHVHFSPIFYLLLPFYALSPGPEVLQVLQAAVVTSAVIPLWLLSGRHGLKDWQKALVCGIFLLFPAFSGGTSYDIHENCFLTPLLLWLFYGIDSGKIPVIALSALLTLTVKEDAPVYVAVIGLFLILTGFLRKRGLKSREMITGLSLTAGAVLWFLAVTAYLKHVGQGIMTYRYDNFLFGSSQSLITVIRAVLLNPMKAVFECVDREKLRYIYLTLLPLLGLPLITRKYERYLLMIPYVLMNLMSDYTYQHDVFFQYSFGSVAFLFYLVVVNLADLKTDWKKALILGISLVLTGLCFSKVIVPRATPYTAWQEHNQEEIRQVDVLLSRIPEDASVASVTFYTPQLSQRDVLYDVEYSSLAHILSTEYVVLSDEVEYKTWVEDGVNGKDNLLTALSENGYTLWQEIPNRLSIYRKSNP